ncbi:MAG: hypothetical protein A2X64_02505 [Ignavibacteria bacterium GWF2_33_9]|nr:MAG: hypothetical protein A2X64_02505 [Ignavibacteria bacterium GWF2_33_9]
MKNIFYIIIFCFLLSNKSYSEITLHIHSFNGSVQDFNVSDISDITFSNEKVSSFLILYNKVDSLNFYIDLQYIKSIAFESSNLLINSTDTTLSFQINQIDSIVVLPKKEKLITVNIYDHLECLKNLKINSYVDFLKPFNSQGKANIYIKSENIPQLVFVTDNSGNLIAMSLIKSTETSVTIDVLSTVTALVYENAKLMGMNDEKSSSMVVDYIMSLNEVHYIASFLEDDFINCKSFINSIEKLTPILRLAYLKTYEYATGETLGKIEQIAKNNNKIAIQNETIDVYPAYSPSLNVSTEKDDSGNYWMNVSNKLRRHVSIRESGVSNQKYELAPTKNITGFQLSNTFDNQFQTELSIKREIPSEPLHTIGISTNRPGNEKYFELYEDPIRFEAISRTLTSLWLATENDLLTGLIPYKLNDYHWKSFFKIISKEIALYIQSKEILTVLNDGLMDTVFTMLCQKMESDNYFWKKVFHQARIYVPLDVIQNIILASKVSHTENELGFLSEEFSFSDEYIKFTIDNPNLDVEPPKAEFSPYDYRKINANANILIPLNITDNTQLKKVLVYIDDNFNYPIAISDINGTMEKYTSNWSTSGLIGLHFINAATYDANENHANNYKIALISGNPDNSYLPDLKILSPEINEIDSLINASIIVQAESENNISKIDFYLNGEKIQSKEFFILNKLVKDTLIFNSTGYMKDSVSIKIIAYDWNFKKVEVNQKFKVINQFSKTPPVILWQKCFGGTNDELLSSIIQTHDGGYIMAGSTNSNDVQVSGNNGKYDFWIVKTDAEGKLKWQKCVGGSRDDFATSIIETKDGDFIVAGYTESFDKDIPKNHGAIDVMVVKIAPNGTVLWVNTLGGTFIDEAHSIIQTSDGGFILVGETKSNDQDVTDNRGNSDFWVVKLTEAGNIQWQRCFGGSRDDIAYSVIETSYGGYVVAGETQSIDGDISENHGSIDAWIISLDYDGTPLGEKSIGGSETDKIFKIEETADGDFLIAGESQSSDGDIKANYGESDFFFARLKYDASIKYGYEFGGIYSDYCYGMEQLKYSNYLLAGSTGSNEFDVSGNHGKSDVWIIKIMNDGTKLWQKCLGGTGNDVLFSIDNTKDACLILGGQTDSNNGDVSGGKGNKDYWLIKIK